MKEQWQINRLRLAERDPWDEKAKFIIMIVELNNKKWQVVCLQYLYYTLLVFPSFTAVCCTICG